MDSSPYSEIESEDIPDYINICRMINLGMLGMNLLYPQQDLKEIKFEIGLKEDKVREESKREPKIISRELYISKNNEEYDASLLFRRAPEKAVSEMPSPKLLWLVERALKELRQKGYNIWRA